MVKSRVEDKPMFEKNARAINLPYCALNTNEYNRVSACEMTKQIWDKLEITYQENHQVKEFKIDILVLSIENEIV